MLLPSAKPKRLLYIDSLRGLAALYVLLFHVGLSVKPSNRFLLTVVENGERGVQLFYLISAYTLFYSLNLRSTDAPDWKRKFFVRRFFRIAPLFYISLILYLALYGWGPRFALGRLPGVSLLNVLANILFINGFSPYWIGSIVPVGWSIAVEMSFYLLIPALYRIITSLGRALVCSVTITAGALLVSRAMLRWAPIPETALWRMFVDHWIVSQLPIFSFGLILYFLLARLEEALPRISEQRVKRFGLALLAGSIAFYLLVIYGFVPFFPKYILSGIGFVPLVLGLRLFPLQLLVNRFTAFLGKLSYSLYLMHTVCLHEVLRLSKVMPFSFYVDTLSRNETVRFSLLFFATLFLSTILSLLTYHLIEEPGQRLGKKVFPGLEAKG